MKTVYDDASLLEHVLLLSDRDQTMLFFNNMKVILESGGTPPRHWMIAAVQMLLDAGEARTSNHKNPLADALCMTYVGSDKRNSLYGSIVAAYFLKGRESDDNKGIGWATKEAKYFISKRLGKNISAQALKDIFDKNKNQFIENAEYTGVENSDVYLNFLIDLNT